MHPLNRTPTPYQLGAWLNPSLLSSQFSAGFPTGWVHVMWGPGRYFLSLSVSAISDALRRMGVLQNIVEKWVP